MKAIILAGGKGTRLQSVINDIPKPMAPIAGKPFLEYLIMQLKSWMIRDIILSVGYKKESIISHFSNGSQWGVSITYLQEPVPLGTGGAIRESLQSIDDEHALIMNGDSFFDGNLSDLTTYHLRKNALATLALLRMTDTGRYGRVELTEQGEITSFREKDSHREGLMNTGIYIVNRKVLSFLPAGAASFEHDVLTRLAGKGLFGYEQEGFFIDIGIPSDYAFLCDHPEKLGVRASHG